MLSPRTTIWENNPLASGTGLMMAKCAFDRDAIPILPTQATQMLKKRGLHRSGAVPFFLPDVASVPTSARALVEFEPARWSILSSGEKTIDA